MEIPPVKNYDVITWHDAKNSLATLEGLVPHTFCMGTQFQVVTHPIRNMIQEF